MKKHTAIYLTAMGYDESDWICCEVFGCEAQAVDIHHIIRRGAGGSKTKDYIENLMGCCRHHHEKYGDKTGYINFLKACHRHRMIERQVPFNNDLIQIEDDLL